MNVFILLSVVIDGIAPLMNTICHTAQNCTRNHDGILVECLYQVIWFCIIVECDTLFDTVP